MEFSSTGGDEPRDDVKGHCYPTLRQLGLDLAELESLRRKGYLTKDDRGHGHDGFWRLRFRHHGRLRAVYLGRDMQLVGAVRRELDDLRYERRQERSIAKLTVEGSRALRAAKRRLEPVLRRLGYHYHGDKMRKTRDDTNVVG